jgi:hypothetical protein
MESTKYVENSTPDKGLISKIQFEGGVLILKVKEDMDGIKNIGL